MLMPILHIGSLANPAEGEPTQKDESKVEEPFRPGANEDLSASWTSNHAARSTAHTRSVVIGVP